MPAAVMSPDRAIVAAIAPVESAVETNRLLTSRLEYFIRWDPLRI